MTRSHTISAIFLTFVSANIIQGAIIPQLFQKQAFPNFVNLASIPRFGELSNGFASSAASAASNALSGFRTYFNDFRTGLGQQITIPPRYGALNRFVYGEVWPDFAGRAARVVPGNLVAPGSLGGNVGGASSAASSAAASGGANY